MRFPAGGLATPMARRQSSKRWSSCSNTVSFVRRTRCNGRVAAALDVDMTPQIDAYRRKRDMIVAGLADCYDVVRPSGSFYIFPKAPWGTGTEFVTEAMREASIAHYSRRGVQPPRHPFPHLLRRRRSGDRTRNRGIAKAGGQGRTLTITAGRRTSLRSIVFFKQLGGAKC